MILNVTVFVVRVWGRTVKRGTDTDFYRVFCEDLEDGIRERN